MSPKLFLRAAMASALGMSLSTSVATGQRHAPERREPLLEEFFLAESVVPQSRGELQFTMTGRGTWHEGSRLLRPSVAIEYGLTDAWELDFGFGAFSAGSIGGVVRDQGINSATVGLRRFFSALSEQRLSFVAALETAYSAPATLFDEQEALAVEPSVVVGYEVAALGNMQLFAGASFERSYLLNKANAEDEREGSEVAWNAGFLAPAGKFRFLLEASNESSTAPLGLRERVVLAPAIALPLADGWEVMLGSVVGTARPRPSDFILKVTYEP